jgi:hypothetical protein
MAARPGLRSVAFMPPVRERGAAPAPTDGRRGAPLSGAPRGHGGVDANVRPTVACAAAAAAAAVEPTSPPALEGGDLGGVTSHDHRGLAVRGGGPPMFHVNHDRHARSGCPGARRPTGSPRPLRACAHTASGVGSPVRGPLSCGFRIPTAASRATARGRPPGTSVQGDEPRRSSESRSLRPRRWNRPGGRHRPCCGGCGRRRPTVGHLPRADEPARPGQLRRELPRLGRHSFRTVTGCGGHMPAEATTPPASPDRPSPTPAQNDGRPRAMPGEDRPIRHGRHPHCVWAGVRRATRPPRSSLVPRG